MHKKWTVLLCLFVVALGVVAPAEASWRTFHWSKPRKEQRVILVLYSTGDGWTNQLAEAVGAWGISSDIDFVWREGSTDRTSRRRCRLPSGYGQIHVCNYRYRWNDAARSEIKVAHGRHIQKGWVKLNNSVKGVRRSVVCHEFGHVLGLGHRSAKSSCMYNALDAWPPNPDWDDYVAVYRRTHHHRHKHSGKHEVETVRFHFAPRVQPVPSEKRSRLLALQRQYGGML